MDRHPISFMNRVLDAVRMRGPRADLAVRRHHPHGLITTGGRPSGLWFGYREEGSPDLLVVAGHLTPDGAAVGFRFASRQRGRSLAAEVARHVSDGRGRRGSHYVDAVLWAISSVSMCRQLESLHGRVVAERRMGANGYWSAECPDGTMALARRLHARARGLTPVSSFLWTAETGHMAGIATFPPDDVHLVACAVPRARRMARIAEAFLSGVNERALAALKDLGLDDWLGDGGWDAIAGAGGGEVNCLLEAVTSHRWMRDLVLRAHARAPGAFNGPNPPGARSIAKVAASVDAISPRGADLLSQSHAEGGLDFSRAVQAWGESAVPLTDASTSTEGAGTRLLRLAALACPPSRMPASVAEWDAFMRAGRATSVALSILPPGMSPVDFLDSDGDWDGFRTRAMAAAGLSPSSDLVPYMRGRTRDLALEDMLVDHVVGTGDLVTGLANQVIVPALVVAGGADLERHARRLAATMAYGGGTLAGALRASRSWHRGLNRMALAIEAVDPTLLNLRRWVPGLPDAVIGSVSVTCLATTRDLRDEGWHGTNEDGSEGLGHCVSNYVPKCLDGRSRILSLRYVDAGVATRLATAEIRMPERRGRPGWSSRVEQVRGLRNGEPPREAAEALRGYLAMLDAGTLEASTIPRTTRGPMSAAIDNAGYDFRRREAWNAVWDIWKPHVRRAARTWDGARILAEARLMDDPAPDVAVTG